MLLHEGRSALADASLELYRAGRLRLRRAVRESVQRNSFTGKKMISTLQYCRNKIGVKARQENIDEICEKIQIDIHPSTRIRHHKNMDWVISVKSSGTERKVMSHHSGCVWYN